MWAPIARLVAFLVGERLTQPGLAACDFQAYHSAYNEDPDARICGSMSILPIRSRIRGPAPTLTDPNQMDIIDESIDLFRANSLFRNFEIKGPADRVSPLRPPAAHPNAR